MSDPAPPLNQEEYEIILAHSPRRECLGIPRDWERVREGFHPFSPERVILRTGQILQDFSRNNRSASERIRTRAERLPSGSHNPLGMSQEKFDLLVMITDRMANHYGRSDLAEEWGSRLVRREEMGMSQLGPGSGLLHQFQLQVLGDGVSEKTITLSNDLVDWWLILCPDGANFESLDGNPTYALLGHVFDRSRGIEMDVWVLTGRFEREFRRNHSWEEIAQLDRVTATRLLNYRMAQYLKENPEE